MAKFELEYKKNKYDVRSDAEGRQFVVTPFVLRKSMGLGGVETMEWSSTESNMYFSDIDQIIMNFMKTAIMGSSAKDLKGIVAEFREFRKWVEDNCSLRKMMEEEFVKIGNKKSVVVEKVEKDERKNIIKDVMVIGDKNQVVDTTDEIVVKKRGRPKKVLDI